MACAQFTPLAKDDLKAIATDDSTPSISHAVSYLWHINCSTSSKLLSEIPVSTNRLARIQRWSKWSGAIAVIMGVLVLLGWGFNLQILRSILPNLPSMKASTAISLILGGGSLWRWHHQERTANGATRQRDRLSSWLAIGVILISLLSFIQYQVTSLWHSQPLVSQPIQPIELAFLAPMAPNTALCFLLLGVAIALLHQRNYGVAQACAYASFLIAFLSLTGYAFGVKDFYQSASITGMALHTSLSLVVLSLGVLFAASDQAWLSNITSSYAGGIIARRLLPFALLVPFFTGGLFLASYRANTLSAEIGFLLRTAFNVFIMGGIIWWNAKYLNRVDQQRQQIAEELLQANEHLEAEVAERMDALQRSEERWKLAMAASQDVVWDLNPITNEVFRSESWYDLIGVQPGEIHNSNSEWVDRIHPEDVDRVLATNAAYLSQKVPVYQIEYRLQCQTGYRWVVSRGKAYWNEHGQALRLIGSMRDISEQKKIEEDLRASYSLIHSVINGISDPIFVKAENGQYVLVNQATANQAGKSIAAFIGYDDNTIFPAFTAQELQKNDLQVMQQGKPITIEESIPVGDSIKTFLSSKSPWRDADGNIIGLIGFTKDISDRKQTEIALQHSEERYRSLIEATAQIVWTTAADGQIVEVQPSLAAFTGQSFEQYCGWGWAEVVHPDDLDHVMQIWNHALKTCTLYEAELRFKNTNGEYRYLWARAIPILAEDGSIREWVGTNTDITARKLAELALQQSEEHLRTVLENMPVMLNALDESGNMLVWNQECERVTGYSTEEMINSSNALELLYPDPAYLQQMMTQWANTKNNYRNWEWDLVGKDGNTRTIAWSNISDTFPIPGWATWGIGVDVTEQKIAERSIHQLNTTLEQRVNNRTAELTAANKELEAFSYSVSHDLRAPLRGIDGFSKVLVQRYSDQLDEKGKHYLDRIAAGVQRMGDLIDDLLMLSRVTRTEMQRSQVNLSTIASEIAEGLQAIDPARLVAWKITPNITASGDAKLLKIALENLLSNAWKFTSPKTHPCVEFNSMLDDTGQTIYFVQDNGAGFDMAYENKLFQAFQRLHSTSDFAGTGIGLATVQRIIYRHGGRIWAKGRVDQGATFYFALQQ